jgi:environmental stress-induced protein Ves
VARSFIIGSVNDLNEVLKRVKLPVVMKIISSEHTHKNDVGGVITGINCVKAAVGFQSLEAIRRRDAARTSEWR